jgi:hypothetical protein
MRYNKELKRLNRIILGKGSKAILKYSSDSGEEVYLIPREIKGNDVYGFIITPSSTKPTHIISLGSLLEHKLSVADFKKLN